MSYVNHGFTSFEDYLVIRENTDRIVEYIEGNVFMVPFPSTQHQKILGRLHAQLFHFLNGKECEVFVSPYDIELKRTGIDGTKIVVPDLSVICEKSGFTDTKYVGVPTLVVEIVSPLNQSHDLVFKQNLYMQYHVKEYWIINPMLNHVQVFLLNKDGQYEQHEAIKDSGIVHSVVLSGFRVDVQEIFS